MGASQALLILVVVAIAAWVLGTFVSGTLAAIVALAGCAYVLIAVIGGGRLRP